MLLILGFLKLLNIASLTVDNKVLAFGFIQYHRSQSCNDVGKVWISLRSKAELLILSLTELNFELKLLKFHQFLFFECLKKL